MDFLDFIRKVHEERKARGLVIKGGPGSGWFAPPRGTHGKGKTARTKIADKKLSAPLGDTGIKGNEAIGAWLDKRSGPGGWESADKNSRAELKADVAGQLSDATGISEEKCVEFVKQWAHSSNDNDMRSLAIQKDAAAEFGVELSKFTREKIAQSKMEWEEMDAALKERHSKELGPQGYSAFFPFMDSPDQRKLLRAMYDETQAELKARGIKEVRLYRGTKLPKADVGETRIGRRLSVETNVIESWSIDPGVGADFGLEGIPRGHVGLLLESVIPASRILATPMTGFGCLREGEVVVIGGIAGDQVSILDYE